MHPWFNVSGNPTFLYVKGSILPKSGEWAWVPFAVYKYYYIFKNDLTFASPFSFLQFVIHFLGRSGFWYWKCCCSQGCGFYNGSSYNSAWNCWCCCSGCCHNQLCLWCMCQSLQGIHRCTSLISLSAFVLICCHSCIICNTWNINLLLQKSKDVVNHASKCLKWGWFMFNNLHITVAYIITI